jgi:hypothetical protein
MPIIFLFGCITTQSQEISTTRKSLYDAVINDLSVISNDLEVRTMDRATSAYTEAVSNLTLQTQKARELIREKAKQESTDYATYEQWLQQIDAAHKSKLRELGEEKTKYISLWSQRYGQLQKDAEALRVLKQHEKYMIDNYKCLARNCGVCGWFRGLFGRGLSVHHHDSEAEKFDMGGIDVTKLGTLSGMLLP